MGVVAVAGLLALAPVSSTVYAATSAVTTNNTATKNDLLNADIIDESKTGSISIYKYDITAAEAAGEYKAGTYKATGEADSRVESALKDYAIEGVQFSYLRVGNVETHSVQEGTGTTVELVYEIPTDLAKILGLTGKDNVDMTGEKEENPCHNTGVYHVTRQKIMWRQKMRWNLTCMIMELKTPQRIRKQKQESLIFQRQIRTAIPMRRTCSLAYTCLWKQRFRSR